MSERRNIPVRVFTFSEEDQERLLEETILEWRALGPAAAWDAIYDILGCWFEARGLDPEAQRVDRTHIEIRPVPWLTADPSVGSDEIGLTAKRAAGRPEDLVDAMKLKVARELASAVRRICPRRSPVEPSRGRNGRADVRAKKRRSDNDTVRDSKTAPVPVSDL